MRNVARLDSSRLHVPQFLDPDPVALRVDIVELFRRYQFLGERSARSFGQHGDLGTQPIAWRVVVFWLAVLVEAFVFGDDAADSFSLVYQLRPAKFLENIDARSFHESAKPFGHFAK